jgi:phosphatidylserine/phosphatidylglycerophosphate/cardiolipin synthase-like enzyme
VTLPLDLGISCEECGPGQSLSIGAARMKAERMEARFSSLVGGDTLRKRILELIAEAAASASSDRIDVHVMAFSFTDTDIADALAAAASKRPSMTVRLLADWSQRTWSRNQQAGRLSALALPNLRVRYTRDQPYVWDAAAGHMRWSYHASHGLLHHKTLAVLADGRPWRLACGSFNWTASAARSYENVLIFSAEQPEARELISRFELEFEALWSDPFATLSSSDAHSHYQAILEAYHRDPALRPEAIVGLPQGQNEQLKVLGPECYPSRSGTLSLNYHHSPACLDSSVAVAFSSRAEKEPHGRGGHAEANRGQRLFLRGNSGRMRCVPLTITALALDTIGHAASGDTLKIAMYGLSRRVPEYGALLNAARRGVRLQILLDRAVAIEVAARLADAQRLEALPIEVRTVGRSMHQKYLVNTRTGSLLTGTANMSTDASGRHFEHRIRVD